MRTAATIALVAALAFACGDDDSASPEDERRAAFAPALARHRDAVAPKLEALGRIAAAADAAWRVQEVERASVPAGLSLATLDAGTGNALLVARRPQPALASVDWPRELAVAYERGAPDRELSPEQLEQALTALERMTHALVVRVHDYRPPQQIEIAGEPRIDPGRVYGDAILYDLGSGERVGAFPFHLARSDADDEQALLRELRVHLDETFAAFAAGEDLGGSPRAALIDHLDRRFALLLGDAYASAGLQAIELAAEAGVPVVILRADNPDALTGDAGGVPSELTALAAQLLGVDTAIVRIERSAP